MEFLVFLVIALLFSLWRSLAESSRRERSRSPSSPAPPSAAASRRGSAGFSGPQYEEKPRFQREGAEKGEERIREGSVEGAAEPGSRQEGKGGFPLPVDHDTLIAGLVMAEIIEPPRCRRPRRPYYKAGQ